jgi:hypothetical protein
MMTPHRSVYHSPAPRHIPQILAASGCALLILSGVSGLASLLGWIVAGLILAGFVLLGALTLVCWAIAARDIALELPGAME